MRGLRGILAGALTLIALHTLVAYNGPSKRLEELSGIAVGLVDTFLSPAVPAIPDRRAPTEAAPNWLPPALRSLLPPPAPR